MFVIGNKQGLCFEYIVEMNEDEAELCRRRVRIHREEGKRVSEDATRRNSEKERRDKKAKW